MATRWTLDDLRGVAIERGGQLHSLVYAGAAAKHDWECAKGHRWAARWAHVRAGHWCPHCSGLVGWGIERIRAVAEKRGGHCLSDAYVNSQTKLRFACAKGHTWYATPSTINSGTWCPECARARLKAARRHRTTANGDINA